MVPSRLRRGHDLVGRMYPLAVRGCVSKALAAALVVLAIVPAGAMAAVLSVRVAHVATERAERRFKKNFHPNATWEVLPSFDCNRMSATLVYCGFFFVETNGEEVETCSYTVHVRLKGQTVYTRVVADEQFCGE
jgi:hypothetical protein